VLTASHSESDSHCALFAKEPVIQTPKSILVSTYPITGKHQKLLVANVHGINFTLGLESYRQQFKALRQVIQNHQGPLILAGDFNSWRKDRQTILDQLVDELSLRRVGYDSHQRITVFGNPIDHIYYRNLEVIQASSPKVSSSDHNPLLVTFKVAEAAYDRYAQTPE
jgi:endonuclease/exonuclease/phosphatase (EEP) superfamily protein YafD